MITNKINKEVKNLLFFILLLVSHNANAQGVDDFFINAPDTIMPYLKKDSREMMLKFAEADKDTLYSVTNVMENKTWMSYRSDRLIVIHPSEVTTLEFCQVPMANDTIYCFIKTDSAPEAESCVYIYNKVWECLGKVDLGKYAVIHWPDTLSDASRTELMGMIEMKMYSATIDKENADSLIIRQSLPLLSEEEKTRYKDVKMQTKVKIGTIFLK